MDVGSPSSFFFFFPPSARSPNTTEILLAGTQQILILTRKRTTQALIKVRESAGCSAPLYIKLTESIDACHIDRRQAVITQKVSMHRKCRNHGPIHACTEQ